MAKRRADVEKAMGAFLSGPPAKPKARPKKRGKAAPSLAEQAHVGGTPKTKTTGGLFKHTAYFSEDEVRALKAEAYRSGGTMAQIIRDAVCDRLGLPKVSRPRGAPPKSGN